MQEHAHAGQATTASALTSSKCTSNSAVVRMQNNTAHVVLARNAHAQTLAGIGSKQKRTYSYSLQTLGVSDHPSDAAIWDLRRSSWAWTTRGLRVPNKGNRGNAHVGMMSIWRVRLPRRQTRHDTTFNVCTDDGNLEETSRKQAADCTYVRRQRRSSGRLADVAASSNREAATRITVEGVWGWAGAESMVCRKCRNAGGRATKAVLKPPEEQLLPAAITLIGPSSWAPGTASNGGSRRKQ